MVLATEMTRHFEHVSRFVNVVNQPLQLDDDAADVRRSLSSTTTTTTNNNYYYYYYCCWNSHICIVPCGRNFIGAECLQKVVPVFFEKLFSVRLPYNSQFVCFRSCTCRLSHTSTIHDTTVQLNCVLHSRKVTYCITISCDVWYVPYMLCIWCFLASSYVLWRSVCSLTYHWSCCWWWSVV